MRICTARPNLRAVTGLSAVFGLALTLASCPPPRSPEATRGLRTGCDAPLQSVHPGRSACLSLHVRLPALSQPRLPHLLRRPQKESEAPLRNPITGIVGCCARATSGQAAALPSVARLHYQFGKLSRCAAAARVPRAARPPRCRASLACITNSANSHVVLQEVDYTGFDGSSARTACIRLPGSTLYFCAHPLRFCGR